MMSTSMVDEVGGADMATPSRFRRRPAPFSDRFIPYRPGINIESAHRRVLASDSGTEAGMWGPAGLALSPPGGGATSPLLLHGETSEWAGPKYQRLLSWALDDSPARILPLSSPSQQQPGSRPILRRQSSLPSLDELGASNQEEVASPMTSPRRRVPERPDAVVDITGMRDDFYCDLLDWGRQDAVAVGLGDATWVWSARTRRGQRLQHHYNQERFYVSSVAWNPGGRVLAIGTSLGDIHLWDAVAMKKLPDPPSPSRLQHRSPSGVVECLAWSRDLLVSGTRNGHVHVHDRRASPSVLCDLQDDPTNRHDVTNMKFTTDGETLASGRDSGIVNLWSMRTRRVIRSIAAHNACTKALAWCPWRQSILATGGGSSDGHVRLWHVNTGEKVVEVDTKSQVCAMVWNSEYHELATSHGSTQPEGNVVLLWQDRGGAGLRLQARLLNHRARPLHLALSPDSTTLASASADQTLCLWRCFPPQATEVASPLQLGRSIR